MGRMKINLLSFVIISLFCMAFVSASMVRSVPSSADGTFQVTYEVDNAGNWGASIVDTVSGGCKFPGGVTQLRTVMLSTDGNTKTVSVTVPSSGTCTFNGDYKFGTLPEVDFPDASVSISENNGNGNGTEIPYMWIAVAVGVLFLLIILKKK